MQKKLIALAIASMATSAAFAQSADTVVLYGRADVGLVSIGGKSDGTGAAKRTNQIASGVQAGSRVGFRGTENLGSGLKAIFEFEFGARVDEGTNGAATWGNRHSYVGLSSSTAGTVVIGRLDDPRYGVFGKYDPFANGTVANITQLSTIIDRANNAIAYVSPDLSGFKVTLGMATHAAPGSDGSITEHSTNSGDNRWSAIMLSYDNGPLSLAADYEQVKPKDGTVKQRFTTIGGSYDLKAVKIGALYDQYKKTDAGAKQADERSYFVSVSAPVNNLVLKGVAGQWRNKLSGSNAKATKIGVGLDYFMSKRTSVYVDYGKVSNKQGAAKQLSYSGNAQSAGLGTNGFDIGIAHRF